MPDIDKKSSVYNNRGTACISGWNEIKNKITDAWSIGVSARLNGRSCELVKAGKVIDHLYFFIPNSTIPGSLQLFRGDGSIISYEYYGNGSFRSVSGENGQLEQFENGEWQYTNSGMIERYSAKGKLLYILQNGEKQTFTYSASLKMEKEYTRQINVFYIIGKILLWPWLLWSWIRSFIFPDKQHIAFGQLE